MANLKRLKRDAQKAAKEHGHNMGTFRREVGSSRKGGGGVMLTDKEYAEKGGCACPYCGSNDLDAGARDFDFSGAYCNVTCGDCEEEWTEQYKLVGFEPMKEYAHKSQERTGRDD